MSVDYSITRDEIFLKEMIEYFGADRIPNPEQYPLKFEFMTKSFEHHKKMKTNNEVVVT